MLSFDPIFSDTICAFGDGIISFEYGFPSGRLWLIYRLLQTIKRQEEMLFVRGDSVVLISPQA